MRGFQRHVTLQEVESFAMLMWSHKTRPVYMIHENKLITVETSPRWPDRKWY